MHFVRLKLRNKLTLWNIFFRTFLSAKHLLLPFSYILCPSFFEHLSKIFRLRRTSFLVIFNLSQYILRHLSKNFGLRLPSSSF